MLQAVEFSSFARGLASAAVQLGQFGHEEVPEHRHTLLVIVGLVGQGVVAGLSHRRGSSEGQQYSREEESPHMVPAAGH